MSTLGVSRSGRVRKKSAKAVEMDGIEEGDERRKTALPENRNGENVTRIVNSQQRVNNAAIQPNSTSSPFKTNLPMRKPLQVPAYDNVMDSSSSLSSDSDDSGDSSDNDSDSDSFCVDRANTHQVPHLPLHDLNKMRPNKNLTQNPPRPRKPARTGPDPPYNPKTGAPRLSSLQQPQKGLMRKSYDMNRHLNSDLSSSNGDSDDSGDDDDDLDDDSDSDSDDDSDSGDSLVIAGGDGFTKKAPLRKLTLPIAAAAALVSAQRQQIQKREEIDEDLSEETNDKDDDDFVPSSAKKRRPNPQHSRAKPKAMVEKKIENEQAKKPKSPSAYVMYCTETRRMLLAENPNLTFSELSKRMGKMWNVLPEKDKQLWRRKAKALQERNASGLISTSKPPVSHPTKNVKQSQPKTSPNSQQRQVAQKGQRSTPVNVQKSMKPPTIAARLLSKQQAQTSQVDKSRTVTSGAAQNVPLSSKVQSVMSSPSSAGRLAAKISNYQDLLDQPVEPPPRPFGLTPLDAAAHLKVLGDSLTTIGTNLMAHQGPIAVSGSLSVLLDSTLCALGPLVCLTTQLEEMDGTRPETLKKILNNIAYIMPGL